MKKQRAAGIALFVLLASLSFGQELQDIKREVKALSFTEDELTAVETAVQKGESDLVSAQGEIKVLQAKLELKMTAKEPSIEEIKKLVRESLEWEFKIRIVKIERNMAIRKILGDDRWAQAFKLARRYTLIKKAGKESMAPEDQKAGRAFKILESLQ